MQTKIILAQLTKTVLPIKTLGIMTLAVKTLGIMTLGIMTLAITALAIIVCTAEVVLAQSSIRLDDFSSSYPAQKLPSNWEKKTVKLFASKVGEEYQFVNQAGENYIRMATGPKNFFNLSSKTLVYPTDYPILSWEWKVDRFPSETDAYQNLRRDKAAALCLFDTPTSKTKYRALCYVWELTGKKDLPIIVPYNKRVAFIVLRTKKDDQSKQWYQEKRNLLADFKTVWKKSPQAGKITLFLDSDTSKSQAEAFFRQIVLSKSDLKPEPIKAGK